jgi:hypothetical protein
MGNHEEATMEPTNVTCAPTPVGWPLADGQDYAGTGAVADDFLKELEAIVQLRLGSRIRDLQIVAAADGLILRGNSNSWYAKQLAQHAVMEAVRIRILANEIVVS